MRACMVGWASIPVMCGWAVVVRSYSRDGKYTPTFFVHFYQNESECNKAFGGSRAMTPEGTIAFRGCVINGPWVQCFLDGLLASDSRANELVTYGSGSRETAEAVQLAMDMGDAKPKFGLYATVHYQANGQETLASLVDYEYSNE